MSSVRSLVNVQKNMISKSFDVLAPTGISKLATNSENTVHSVAHATCLNTTNSLLWYDNQTLVYVL